MFESSKLETCDVKLPPIPSTKQPGPTMVHARVPRCVLPLRCDVSVFLTGLEGGSFDPWGGPGYDACEVLTGPDFQDVFYKQNWASNVKLISYYMLYGYVAHIEIYVSCLIGYLRGTSWGGIPFPGVYTRYENTASPGRIMI